MRKDALERESTQLVGEFRARWFARQTSRQHGLDSVHFTGSKVSRAWTRVVVLWFCCPLKVEGKSMIHERQGPDNPRHCPSQMSSDPKLESALTVRKGQSGPISRDPDVRGRYAFPFARDNRITRRDDPAEEIGDPNLRDSRVLGGRGSRLATAP